MKTSILVNILQDDVTNCFINECIDFVIFRAMAKIERCVLNDVMVIRVVPQGRNVVRFMVVATIKFWVLKAVMVIRVVA